jgi:hypothetical protein
MAVHCLGGVSLVEQTACGGIETAIAAQHVTRRAEGGVVVMEAKVPGGKTLDGFGFARSLLVIQRIGLVFVFGLTLKALIAATHY